VAGPMLPPEAWMVRVVGRTYAADGTSPSSNSPGHNFNDPMVALIDGTLTPAEVLDPGARYDYDSLQVEL
jgi:hypothetical protein